LTSTSGGGVLFFFPESDPRCGPGRYLLSQIGFYVQTVAAGTFPVPTTFKISLYPANVTSHQPTNFSGSVDVVKGVSSTPAFAALLLPSALFVDTVVSRYWILVWTSSVPLYWYANG